MKKAEQKNRRRKRVKNTCSSPETIRIISLTEDIDRKNWKVLDTTIGNLATSNEVL